MANLIDELCVLLGGEGKTFYRKTARNIELHCFNDSIYLGVIAHPILHMENEYCYVMYTSIRKGKVNVTNDTGLGRDLCSNKEIIISPVRAMEIIREIHNDYISVKHLM